MQTVKELKVTILEKITVEELKSKYDTMAEQNPLFKKNKQMAYMMIATEVGATTTFSFASGGKEAFPLKIDKIGTSEKENFNVSGYLTSRSDLLISKNKKKTAMCFFTVSDDTGSLNMVAFNDQVDTMLEMETGTFVKVSNLQWKDKADFMPIYGMYSGISEVEKTFEIEDIVGHSTTQVKGQGTFVLKGLVTMVTSPQMVYHCENGHWQSGMTDADIGSTIKCKNDKCTELIEVQKSFTAENVVFADENGFVNFSVPSFAEVKEELKVMDEGIVVGYVKDDKFNINSIQLLKKN